MNLMGSITQPVVNIVEYDGVNIRCLVVKFSVREVSVEVNALLAVGTVVFELFV